MRGIARKIEYSATTIYLYFKDKREIFVRLMEQYYKRLLAIMLDIQEKHGEDPLLCIRKGMRAYTDFGLENPNYYKLAFMLTPEIPREDYMDRTYVGYHVLDTLRGNVSACIEAGIFRKTDVETATQILWCMNHGITSLLISNPGYPWTQREKLIDSYIEKAVAGLKA
jgi:AcrR family transcriptional regulator